MLDAPPQPVLQRAHGVARVGFVVRDGATRLADLYQAGSAKGMFPRVAGPVPEVVFLNTSGGLTGGDRYDVALSLAPRARAVATTQTAERAYRAGAGAAEVALRFTVGTEGWLDWLPQETILFEASALSRQTTVDLGPGAGCLLLETTVLGRAAMGEVIGALHLTDRRIVRREGRPVLIEPLRIDAATLSRRAAPAIFGGARALATLAMVAPGAEDALGAARAVLGVAGVETAASGHDGKLTVRMLAPDLWPLKRQIAALLAALRAGPLPRVWQI